MDFQVSTSALVGALSQLAPIAHDKKSTMPILSCVLLNAEQTPEGGRITLNAYDLEVGMVVTVPAEIKKPGAVALPSKTLLDVTKALPSPVTRLKLAASNRVEITSGESMFRVAGQAAEDFPAIPEAKEADYFPTSDLKGALGKVAFAMSDDETRYALNGIYLDMQAGKAVATDGHRMALAEVEVIDVPGVIVSRKTVATLRKLLAGEGANHGEFAVTDASLLYRRQGLRLVSRLVDGQFPAYQQVMPEKSGEPVTVNSASLRDALQRVTLMGDRASAVQLKLAAGVLTLTARQADVGEAVDSVPVEGGKDLVLNVNGTYLLDMVLNTQAPSVAMFFGDETSPVLVESMGEGPTYILMPMRG